DRLDAAGAGEGESAAVGAEGVAEAWVPAGSAGGGDAVGDRAGGGVCTGGYGGGADVSGVGREGGGGADGRARACCRQAVQSAAKRRVDRSAEMAKCRCGRRRTS